MEMSPSAQRKLVAGPRARVEDLLKRYPDLTAAEDAELLRFLKKGPVLDVGLMSADDQLRPLIDRFRADHGSDFSLGWREYLLVALIVAALVAVCALLWDSGLR